jgi:alpha-1,3-glucosyltransferase
LTFFFFHSLLATLLAILPISIHLGIAPSRRRFLYALINSSLAFFLFSFQVHEKSILLPLLPVSLLVLEEPVSTTIFTNVAMFSMFPLLKREGLVLAYYITTIMWNWLVGGYSLNTSLTTRIGTLVNIEMMWQFMQNTNILLFVGSSSYVYYMAYCRSLY